MSDAREIEVSVDSLMLEIRDEVVRRKTSELQSQESRAAGVPPYGLRESSSYDFEGP